MVGLRIPSSRRRTEPGSKSKINGCDHEHGVSETRMADGGAKSVNVHGATDEFGFRAVEIKVRVNDLHTTILKLIGFDHEKFTYRYAGRDFRLTDVHGTVVDELIA